MVVNGVGSAVTFVDGQDPAETIWRGEFRHVSLVAHARVDNVEELRLATGGEPGASLVDTVARAYLKWGVDFPAQVAGDFAIVLWDSLERRLVACRDPFGVYPLVYRVGDGTFWFASHVEQLLGTLAGIPALDQRAVVEHLTWTFRSHDATFFRDVRQVPAGHVFQAGPATTARMTRYWYPPGAISSVGDQRELHEELRRLFHQSVRRRLASHGTTVVHVSGGLDSSSIAIAADRLLQLGTPPAAKVIGASEVYPGLACDESPFIDAVAASVRFPIERWDGTRSEATDLTDPYRDGPGGQMTTTSGHDGDVLIAQRTGSRVVLSGLGGDDLMMYAGFIRDLIMRGQVGAAFRAIFLASGNSPRALMRRSRIVAGYFLPATVRRARARAAFEVPPWLAPDLHDAARDLAPEAEPEAALTFLSYVQRRAWMRLTTPVIARSTWAMQRKAMSLGFEYRHPYYDRDLVNFVLTMPVSSLPGPERFGRIHRGAFREMLPPEVANRYGKAEFTPALRNRVLLARPIIEDRLFGDGWVSDRYLRRNELRRFWQRLVDRPMDARPLDWWRLWAAATLEAWMRREMGYHVAPQEASP
jgi:asparagine synthase (glutamine-hydrolysing)